MNTWIKPYIHFQIKLIPVTPLIICVLLVFASPLIFSLRMLSFKEAADIGELYISLIGLILLPSVCFTEKDRGTAEVVFTRKAHPVGARTVRLLMVFLILFMCCSAFSGFAWLQDSTFDTTKITLGVFITAGVTGMLGYTVGIMTGSMSLSYLLPFAWYGLEIFTGGKYTKELYLFSLRTGEFSRGKIALSIILAGMIMFNIAYMRWNKKIIENV